MIISLIAAISENYVLGKDNKLVWSMPTDQEYYKKTVENHTIIMGRKTAESSDMFFSSVRNILITRDVNYEKEGFETFGDLKEAVDSCKEEEVFITGGEQIYRLALPLADRLYLTRIHHSFEGDSFFPKFDEAEWTLTSAKHCEPDELNPYPFTFEIWSRI
ncbi:dihydrofolate reductase [Flammeovirgaceae bacterium SG7u.111]|nr:dihydrofolate reductase [Flammeovirgaceae bacterium SG7u.132]WPO35227.1 dihydrofolate reductase [Flammeovirgaceae bacterium SG7u.111]